MMDIAYGKPGGAQDWEAIRGICCRTASSGQGIPEERRGFFAEYWVGPYERWAPDWTHTARHDGKVIGYLTGCPATAPFVLRRHFLHRWPLLWKSLGVFKESPDARAFRRKFLGLEADPARRLALKFLGAVLTIYPAHLHVNVDPAFHGKGVGRRLMDLFILRLREERVPGVHLVCGDGPRGFYESLGFRELARGELKAGAALHAMGLLLA
ncbi:MAG: GNAT family N-acetyltransferase [Elusimicrobia bacterium]|nr:GNAT family N-acetyltransferase [Elusimicrobiota bacterium]